MHLKRFASLLLIGSATLLGGCAEMVVGGAATGVAVVHDRRTTGTVVEDQSIELKALRALLADKSLSSQSHVNFTSYNMMLLITGETPNESMRGRLDQLARKIPKVRRVHNEVAIAAPSSLMTRSSDALITTRVKAGMLQVKHIDGFDPTRVKVVTENGTVFLMGLVSRREADAGTEVARRTGGVQRVVKLFEYLD
ncbi:BON domain-containing protein [Solemya pervernicosa gill symbiont]|uniref:BON domain-containing protein n=2 Tax=Gammaproteobacteria incertae sedis TaxID=118884 RepID=A0A1T2L9S3_9GAMM|nr:BON domain-containing protein [Candidatus Reidiella endopervernicosa]OOZ41859.1 BON domain-containing protein [Solemya pervernicosa gill symbiont]QKQ26185.1 BON domain-containing protein [Candidatus Reidiella endopervernicosa]